MVPCFALGFRVRVRSMRSRAAFPAREEPLCSTFALFGPVLGEGWAQESTRLGNLRRRCPNSAASPPTRSMERQAWRK